MSKTPLSKIASMVRLMLITLLFIGTGSVCAQAPSPVSWNYYSVPINESEALLYFTATLEGGWHVYSQFIEEGGPLPTTFTFSPSRDYTLVGKVAEEGVPEKSYDQVFMMSIVWYSKTAVFSQRVKLNVPHTTIKGTIEFMACREDLCLPPEAQPFTIKMSVKNETAPKTKG